MNITSSLRIGSEPFPGYRLNRLLGRGGFGHVWEAETGSGRVALKFLPCKHGRSAADELRAIQAIRPLRHPGLVRIDQVWCQPGYLVVSMELADGTLADLLALHQSEAGQPMAPAMACRYLSQAAAALDFLNARQHRLNGLLVGYQHCDIKPSNLLLFGEKVKLTDFGLTAATGSQSKIHDRVGTCDYAAPEVFQGQLSSQGDQYSLAVVYIELRTGQLPFPPIETFRPSWPQRRPAPELEALTAAEQPVLRRALDRVPQNRWPSCQELMNQLRQAVGEPRLQTPRR